jgi:hypothetical protein
MKRPAQRRKCNRKTTFIFKLLLKLFKLFPLKRRGVGKITTCPLVVGSDGWQGVGDFINKANHPSLARVCKGRKLNLGFIFSPPTSIPIIAKEL